MSSTRIGKHIFQQVLCFTYLFYNNLVVETEFTAVFFLTRTDHKSTRLLRINKSK